MSNAVPERRELETWRAKGFYGFGSVAYGIKDFGFGSLLLFYYNQVIGLPAVEVSFAIALVLVFDAFADPIIGQFSDNLRTKWGRRHPLMYASAVPVAISYYFLWVPPDGWSHQALFYYLVVMAILVRFLISMYEIPSSSLVPEMTDNYDQRTTFISVRYLFGVIAGVAISFVTFRYIFFADAAHPVAQLNPAGYPRFALASAIIMVASILISARGTHRYIPLFRVPEQRRITLGQVVGEMASSLAHRQFLFLIGAAVFGTMAISLGAGLLIYFNTYFWGLTTKQIGFFSLTSLASAFIAPLIAAPASVRFGKKNAALAFYFGCVALAVTPLSLRLLDLFPANGTMMLFVLLFLERTLSTILGVGCLILFGSMMADVVEDSAVRTGRRSEGLFFASVAFINKLLSAGGTILTGVILRLAEFPVGAKPATLDPLIVRHLAELYLPALIGFYGVGIIVLSRYRISREQHQENVRLLSESEAEAAVAVAAAPPAQ